MSDHAEQAAAMFKEGFNCAQAGLAEAEGSAK